MNCRTAEGMLTKYLRHELSVKELDEFMGHIESCEECREELKTCFTVDRAVRLLDLEEDSTGDPDFEKLFEQDLKRSRRYLANRTFLRFLMIFCGIVALLALVIALIIYVL